MTRVREYKTEDATMALNLEQGGMISIAISDGQNGLVIELDRKAQLQLATDIRWALANSTQQWKGYG